MPERFTAEQFYMELEELGEGKVRERLAAKIYSSVNHKKELAEEWLRRIEKACQDELEKDKLAVARAAASEASRASSAAERAASAAESQAETARNAKNIAIAAAIIAAISIMTNVIAILAK